ncbi:MAG TPA: amidohydrolase [Thermoanaerobaculaceae bacterium]|nr:amidohydrolase [Thermoanaerobaculaceae bacterium]HPS78167.1 amidohydrolase [Thermoanaerobaculaceae bacterium]
MSPIIASVLLAQSSAPATLPPTGGEAKVAVVREVEALYPTLATLYLDLHGSPELSFQEVKTSGKLAERLRTLGFEITAGVGKTGVVAVLRNGAGPTVLVRTDLDALPVEEKTGLPYASHATGTSPSGETVPVMHACGHDAHMTSWVGTATVLARLRNRWHGTLVMLAQPAEEIGQGARTMLADGLFARFGRPDFALAFHVMPDQPVGTVGIRPGPLFASADSVDLRFFGVGGHGALPNKTVDPIVIAARFVLAVQTLVSRENDPFEPAVVTVGSIHGGTKHNIIPDEVRLQLTVRATSDANRKRLLAGIERIARAEAEAGNAPRPPEVVVSQGLPPVVNDQALSARIAGALRSGLGAEHVVEARQVMVSEDFALLGQAGVPALLMLLGTSDPQALAEAQRTGTPLPALHSPLFAPVVEPTLKTGVTAMTLAALELLR